MAIVSEKGEVKGFLRVAVQAISGVWGTGECVALSPWGLGKVCLYRQRWEEYYYAGADMKMVLSRTLSFLVVNMILFPPSQASRQAGFEGKSPVLSPF